MSKLILNMEIQLRPIHRKKHGNPYSCVYARLSQNLNQLDFNFITVELSTMMKKDLSISVPTLYDMILKNMGTLLVIGKHGMKERKATEKVFGEWRISYHLLPIQMSILENDEFRQNDRRLTQIETFK